MRDVVHLDRVGNVRLQHECTDAYKGQTNHVLLATVDGQVVASAEYTVFDGVPQLSMIRSEVMPRCGLATLLLQTIQARFPDKQIEWGTTTDEGEALRRSVCIEVRNDEWYERKAEFDRASADLARYQKLSEAFTCLVSPTPSQRERYLASVPDAQTWNALHDRKDELAKWLVENRSVTALIRPHPLNQVDARAESGLADPCGAVVTEVAAPRMR